MLGVYKVEQEANPRKARGELAFRQEVRLDKIPRGRVCPHKFKSRAETVADGPIIDFFDKFGDEPKHIGFRKMRVAD